MNVFTRAIAWLNRPVPPKTYTFDIPIWFEVRLAFQYERKMEDGKIVNSFEIAAYRIRH